MVIKHNISAMNANRTFNLRGKSQAKSIFNEQNLLNGSFRYKGLQVGAERFRMKSGLSIGFPAVIRLLINNLDNIAENTAAAESAIRDTDIGTEMVQFSNNNILLQAGQSVLVQANQSKQGALALLQ